MWSGLYELQVPDSADTAAPGEVIDDTVLEMEMVAADGSSTSCTKVNIFALR